MTPVVIDASAGVEILADTVHGRRLAQSLPADAVGWVPEHFYVEVAGVVRHLTVVARSMTDELAMTVLDRLERWHLRQAQPGPLLAPTAGFPLTRSFRWSYTIDRRGRDQWPRDERMTLM